MSYQFGTNWGPFAEKTAPILGTLLSYQVLTAFYAPVIAMLLALVLRGVAFEFRFRTERWRPFWDFAFIGGKVRIGEGYH